MAAAPVVMIAMAALSAASAGISMQQQRLNAEAEAELQAQNNSELDKAAVRQYGDLSAQEYAIQEEAGESSLSAQKEYIKARGRQIAQASAAGTYGTSVDYILSDLKQTAGNNLTRITRNRELQLKDVQQQAEQIRYGARAQKGNRIFSKPTSGQFALAIGSAAASGAMQGASFSGGG